MAAARQGSNSSSEWTGGGDIVRVLEPNVHRIGRGARSLVPWINMLLIRLASNSQASWPVCTSPSLTISRRDRCIQRRSRRRTHPDRRPG
jgi:hypothetical protein